jgi:valyl-tRNA synthetase
VAYFPDRFAAQTAQWIEGLRDWCISRQLWWGHRIPAWYCRQEGCGALIVAREDPEACPHCGGAVVQDPDVLDTWFSSWLWPFSTLGWPERTPDLEKFYPTDALVTAPEILFFWVARMVMAGIEFMGDLPFSDVVLNGTVRDHLGRKMSKSLGNGIDPLVVVERFGADALRYTVVSGSAPGTDQYLNYENLEETFGPGRNFANKLWNAGRFALLNLGDGEVPTLEEVEDSLELADRWILSRLSRATGEITGLLERFRLNDVATAGYAFFWGELADWYLELAKPRLRGEMGETSRDAARATLAVALDLTLRLLHPVVPFITETVWQRLPRRLGDAPSIMVARWPEPRPEWEDHDAEHRVAELQAVIGAVRNLRSEYGVQPGQRVSLRVTGASPLLAGTLATSARPLADLARVDAVTFGRVPGEVGASAVLLSGAEVFLPLEDVIDVEKERGRIRAELERVEGMIAGTRGRLDNDRFVSRAPKEVVRKEREKLASLEEQRAKLAGTFAALEGAA